MSRIIINNTATAAPRPEKEMTMKYTVEQLLALLIECAEVGASQLTELCDAIDNNGDPYQSQFLADVLAYARENSTPSLPSPFPAAHAGRD